MALGRGCDQGRADAVSGDIAHDHGQGAAVQPHEVVEVSAGLLRGLVPAVHVELAYVLGQGRHQALLDGAGDLDRLLQAHLLQGLCVQARVAQGDGDVLGQGGEDGQVPGAELPGGGAGIHIEDELSALLFRGVIRCDRRTHDRPQLEVEDGLAQFHGLRLAVDGGAQGLAAVQHLPDYAGGEAPVFLVQHLARVPAHRAQGQLASLASHQQAAFGPGDFHGLIHNVIQQGLQVPGLRNLGDGIQEHLYGLAVLGLVPGQKDRAGGLLWASRPPPQVPACPARDLAGLCTGALPGGSPGGLEILLLAPECHGRSLAAAPRGAPILLRIPCVARHNRAFQYAHPARARYPAAFPAIPARDTFPGPAPPTNTAPLASGRSSTTCTSR